MKELKKIPTSKIQRATKLAETGLKVGKNYLKYYTERVIKNDNDQAKKNLNKSNANDIYNGLTHLRGSALKAAQMISMDHSIVPEDYVEKFSLSQFSVPPLSKALILKVFQKYFHKSPNELFDEFNLTATKAASIGQVHKAKKDNKLLAVKVQYPGVADSVKSDLALLKPFAMKIFNIKGKGSDIYFKEIEKKLLEETNYELELTQSLEFAMKCKEVKNVLFPKYYPEYSNKKIMTMEWMDGQQLSEFTKTNQDQALGNKMGQTLWDYYLHQIHNLKIIQADPHPGNFLVTNELKLISIDFGCLKKILDSFYTPYFEIAKKSIQKNKKLFTEKLFELEVLKKEDSKEELLYFTEMFYELLTLITKPLNNTYFDFSDPHFFKEISIKSKSYTEKTKKLNFNGNRGSRHFIYINRTFFGLYSLLHSLKSNQIQTNRE